MPDQKITELTADTTPTGDDLVVIVNSPGTAPANRKTTISQLATALSAMISIAQSQVTGLVSALSTLTTAVAGKAATNQKLDDFGTPDDNTDLNATTTYHGLLKKLSNVVSQFMNGEGNWARPGTLVTAVTSSATPTPNADTTDLYDVTALAEAATFGAPTGTPVNSQKLIIRIKDNGVIRALSWNAAYVAGGTSLPTTTVAGKILHVGFIYNTANGLNKWMCVGSQQEA